MIYNTPQSFGKYGTMKLEERAFQVIGAKMA